MASADSSARRSPYCKQKALAIPGFARLDLGHLHSEPGGCVGAPLLLLHSLSRFCMHTSSRRSPVDTLSCTAAGCCRRRSRPRLAPSVFGSTKTSRAHLEAIGSQAIYRDGCSRRQQRQQQ